MTGLLLVAALLAPPIDWANHDYGFFKLTNGVAEMREYVEAGGLHDTHIWTLKGAQAVTLGGRALTMVRISTLDALASGPSREALLVVLFEGKTEIARVTIPTREAQVSVEKDRLIGQWKVGPERFTHHWQLKDGKLVLVTRSY